MLCRSPTGSPSSQRSVAYSRSQAPQLEQVPFLEVQQQTRAKAPYKPCRENREDNTPQIGGEDMTPP